MANRGEKVIVLELLLTEFLLTVKQLQHGTIPKPSQYIASLVAFGVLGGMAGLSPEMGELGAALGGVVLVTTIVNDKGTTVNTLFKTAAGQRQVTPDPYVPPGGRHPNQPS